jgi:hypothetical protein
MTYDQYIDERFAAWMEPVMIGQESSRLQVFRAAANSAAEDLDTHAFSAVLGAHSIPDESWRRWLAGHITAQDEAFVAEGKDELLRRLSAVALMIAMTQDAHPDGILAALTVVSASYSHLTPIIEELTTTASLRIVEMGAEVREREDIEVPNRANQTQRRTSRLTLISSRPTSLPMPRR